MYVVLSSITLTHLSAARTCLFSRGTYKRIQETRCTPRGQAANEQREAFGVRPACWRFRKPETVRKREQAPRTPNASRNSGTA